MLSELERSRCTPDRPVPLCIQAVFPCPGWVVNAVLTATLLFRAATIDHFCKNRFAILLINEHYPRCNLNRLEGGLRCLLRSTAQKACSLTVGWEASASKAKPWVEAALGAGRPPAERHTIESAQQEALSDKSAD
jgi:hypothetical protein